MADAVREPGGELADRLPLVGVLTLMVSGCALRIWGLDAWAFSPDDALHIAEARLDSVSELFTALAREDTHPPLHYLLLQLLARLGADEMAMRASSVLTSLLLIPLAFELGRRVSGTAAGLFAAFLATFSTPLLLQAQVMRPYALELVLLTGALCLVFDDGEERDEQSLANLIGYGVLMALAILSQYSAVIAIAAVGSVRFLHRLRAGHRAEAIRWMGVHVALAGLALVLLWLLAALLLDSDFERSAVLGWLAHGFPQGGYVTFWLDRSMAQLVYLVDPPRITAAVLLGALVLAGCVALRRRPGFELAQMLLVASLLNLGLAIAGIYPFTGSRHALYLVPFVAVLGGAGLQWLWEMLRARTGATTAIGVGLFALSTLATHAYLHQVDVRLGMVGVMEVPLLREHYEHTLEVIEATAQPDEILVGDKQLAYYSWFEGSIHDGERLSKAVGRTRLGGQTLYYYDPARTIETSEDLAHFLDELEALVAEPRPTNLRFASLGWRSGLLFRLATPELASVGARPGDRALQEALARTGARTFNAGQGLGGGVVFVTTWDTLREGLRQASESLDPGS